MRAIIVAALALAGCMHETTMVNPQTGERFVCDRNFGAPDISDWAMAGIERAQLCAHEYRTKGFVPESERRN